MRTFGKALGRILLTLIIAIGLLYFFGPREPYDEIISFNNSDIGPDIDLYLGDQEGVYSNIMPGTEKRIIWHGEKGIQTSIAIVVMHGFSASSEEIRPVPDLVANELGANIYFMRFKGHGRDGEALAKANGDNGSGFNTKLYQPSDRGLEKQLKEKLDYLNQVNQNSSEQRYELPYE